MKLESSKVGKCLNALLGDPRVLVSKVLALLSKVCYYGSNWCLGHEIL